ncbi:MAG: 50S ribosomal protein L25/general stress protein Ctc [Immundisolibacteraceae bacterium]|nr:50S ribosomal protein L25/general stress protein Ctc [Immundisolibacteraceae bacterium]
MSDKFGFDAQLRETRGRGASRQMREAGSFPAIIYGEGKEPVSISLDHNDVWTKLQKEAFHSHILTVTVGKTSDTVIMRDIQYHPYKAQVMHIDFLRIAMDHAMHTTVPLHFINEDTAIGVKQQGGAVSHLMTEVDIECMPADLPEYIEVDLSDLEIDHSIHLSEITLPKGVTIRHLDDAHDQAVVNIHKMRVVVDEDLDEAEAAAEGDADAESSEGDE